MAESPEAPRRVGTAKSACTTRPTDRRHRCWPQAVNTFEIVPPARHQRRATMASRSSEHGNSAALGRDPPPSTHRLRGEHARPIEGTRRAADGQHVRNCSAGSARHVARRRVHSLPAHAACRRVRRRRRRGDRPSPVRRSRVGAMERDRERARSERCGLNRSTNCAAPRYTAEHAPTSCSTRPIEDTAAGRRLVTTFQDFSACLGHMKAR